MHARRRLASVFAVIALALSIYVALSLLAFLVVMAAIIAGSRADVEVLGVGASQHKRRPAAATVRATGG
jgi:hypothetical protein